MMAGKVWTGEEDDVLRETYASASWADVLPRLPGRSRGAAIQRAVILGLSRRSEWTLREIEDLKRLWLAGTAAELLAACGRHSWGSIQQKAVSLGLRRRHSKREANLPVLRELRRLREAGRLTVKHVAARAGYHWNQITVWENGKAMPTLQAVSDWAAALGFDVVLRPQVRRVGAFDKAQAMSRTGQAHARTVEHEKGLGGGG